MIYATIRLNIGGTYTQPLDQLAVLIDEIKEAAECQDMDCVWTVSLVEMTEEEYNALPEFMGH